MERLLSPAYLADFLALLLFVVSWLVYSYVADRYKNVNKPSLLTAMHSLREEWLFQMQYREIRMSDINVLAIASNSCTFLASTSILIIAGLTAALSAPTKITAMISLIPLAGIESLNLITYKVLSMIMLFMYTFFMFTWTIRQNAYCGVLVCCLPQAPAKEADARYTARRLAFMFTLAGTNFNHGLRAYYFSLAMLAWFISPYLFMIATVLVVTVMWNREFHSKTLKAVLRAREMLC